MIIKYEELRFKDDRGNIERLIAFILLDYEYPFMETLHLVDNRSQTQKKLIKLDLIFFHLNVIHRLLEYS